MRAALFTVAICLVLQTGTKAQPSGPFYKDRTIAIVVGTVAGGGYDLYARFVAQHLSRHLPGQPNVIVQNMPGAGSRKAASYLYSVAPANGTVIGLLNQNLVGDSLIVTENRRYDVRRFEWIGRLTSNVELAVARRESKVETIEDARQREVILGATGLGSTSAIIPLMLNRFEQTKFKVVSGYKGSHDVSIALERGEVDAQGALGWVTLRTSFPGWLKEGKVNFLYQIAIERSEDLKAVPTAPELGRSDDSRAALRFFSAGAAIGRSLVAPPNTPADRLKSLRMAFQAMMESEQFRAEAAKRDIDLDPASGMQIASYVKVILATPPGVIELAKQALNAH